MASRFGVLGIAPIVGALATLTAYDDSADRAAAFADACVRADPDDPCALDESCALYLCIAGTDTAFPGDGVTGRFRGWGAMGYDDAEFVTEDGDPYPVWVEGSEGVLDVIPDLGRLGSVAVWQDGSCDGEGGFHGSIAVTSVEGDAEILLAVGNRSGETLAVGVAQFIVETPRDTASCPGAPGFCNEFIHNRPIHVTHDGETHERYPGQGLVTDDGYLFWVGAARSGSGDYVCTDGHGTELDSWWIMEIRASRSDPTTSGTGGVTKSDRRGRTRPRHPDTTAASRCTHPRPDPQID